MQLGMIGLGKMDGRSTRRSSSPTSTPATSSSTVATPTTGTQRRSAACEAAGSIGSRDEYEYADRLLSALRNQFGGHQAEVT